MEAQHFSEFRNRTASCRNTVSNRGSCNGHLGFLLALLLICTTIFSPGLLYAQVEITATGASVHWPAVDVRFHVRCDTGLTQRFILQDLQILDNGRDLTASASLQCFGGGGISTAFVLDASGSMVAGGNAAAKQACARFIDRMDGVSDEATLIWFNQMVNMQQSMTTIKPLLYSAIDALTASGGTAVWDGSYLGLEQLINNGNHNSRAMIVLTDGADNSSTRTPQEVIDLAVRNQVRVFTVMYGPHADQAELKMLADRTYGAFYPCNDGPETIAAFQDIFDEMKAGTRDCVLSYTAACPDGKEHTAELRIDGVCNGADTTFITYTAHRDTVLAQEVHMSLGDATVGENAGTVTIPLNLDAPIGSGIFRSMFFNLRYDTSSLRFRSAEVPAGSVIEGVRLYATPFPASVNLETMSDKPVTSTGRILNVTFDVKNVYDTTCTPVWAHNARFERTCNFPGIDTGRICVTPGIPTAGCAMDWPKTFVWDRSAHDYVPNPFTVKMQTFNTSHDTIYNVRYRIEVDTSIVTLMSPGLDRQNGSPSYIAPQDFQEVTWQLAARPQEAQQDVRVRIIASFDNHQDIDCAATLHLPTAEAGLYCQVSMPTIVRDNQTGFYAPVPFPVTVTVRNLGGKSSDTLHATLSLPPELYFAAPDTLDTKMMTPPVLPVGQEATAQWMVYPRRAEMHNRVLPVRSTVEHRGGNPLECSAALTLPPWINPAFNISLEQPQGHDFCEGESISLEVKGGYTDFLWSTGETTPYITVHESGAYYCTVWDFMGRIGRSDTVVAIKHPLPRPTLMVFGSLPLSFGDSLHLTPGGDYADYAWSTGATESILTVKTAGSYFVRVTDVYGCTGYSDTVVVTVLSAEPLPTHALTFSLYPNPAHTEVVLQLDLPRAGALRIALIDALGRTLRTIERWAAPGLLYETVDVSGLAPGMYLLRLSMHGQQTSRTLTILRR